MSPPGPSTKARRCPVCKRSARPEHAPFCSAKCADIDLGRWLTERYRIATDERPAEGETEADDEAE